jgi:predicted component of type VI protein secretion system
MTPKDVNKTIERLDSQDWKNMKEHLDKKFPSMTLPTVEDFKELVKLYGKFKEYKEGRLN